MYDIGEHENEKFLTMELVDGYPLTQRIGSDASGGGRPLPLAEVAPLIAQVCAGLDAAHHSGVVHCDLKPDNILIAQDISGPRVVITDFGIAKAFQRTAAPRPNPRQFKFDGTDLELFGSLSVGAVRTSRGGRGSAGRRAEFCGRTG